MADETENQQQEELSIDDLYSSSLDQEEFEKVRSSTLLKKGTWTTDPPFVPTIKRDKTNRLIVRFWGKVVLGDEKGMIGFRYSPEARNAVNRETGEDLKKPDRATKNYVMAVKAYEAANGKKLENQGELVAYLRDYPVRLRIDEFNGENMVMSISAVRPPV